jgi:hypothetical protein
MAKGAAKKKKRGKSSKLTRDLERKTEGALSKGCGSQVGAYAPGYVTVPPSKNPQKPRTRKG